MVARIAMNQTIDTHLDSGTARQILQIIEPPAVVFRLLDTHRTL